MSAVMKLPRGITLERIEELEGWMLQHPQVPCGVRHIFSPGLYIREVTIPADTFAMGHGQKTEHMNVLLKGRVTVMNSDGTTTELSAPHVFTGQPGRKVGYVHEDMVWLNIYPTDETDIDKLEEMYLDKSETFEASRPLLTSDADGDYARLLEEIGVSAELVRSQSENEDDQCPFPAGSYKVKVGKSSIHGRGLIATSDIDCGEIIAPARLSGKRTPAGRYTNHANYPNARMIREGDDIYLVALTDIHGCKGGEDGDEITVDYRTSVRLTLGLQT